MGWSSLEPTVPAQAGAEREARLLALVEAGQYVHRWFALQLSIQGRTIELEVSEDALAVGDEADSVRINVNATTAQRIADKLGALLLTPKLSDLIHREANCRLAPSTRAPGPTMASTAEMVAHSRSVDLKKAAAGGRGLCSNVGKDWVLTNRLLWQAERAANYGWLARSAVSISSNLGWPVCAPAHWFGSQPLSRGLLAGLAWRSSHLQCGWATAAHGRGAGRSGACGRALA